MTTTATAAASSKNRSEPAQLSITSAGPRKGTGGLCSAISRDATPSHRRSRPFRWLREHSDPRKAFDQISLVETRSIGVHQALNVTEDRLPGFDLLVLAMPAIRAFLWIETRDPVTEDFFLRMLLTPDRIMLEQEFIGSNPAPPKSSIVAGAWR